MFLWCMIYFRLLFISVHKNNNLMFTFDNIVYCLLTAVRYDNPYLLVALQVFIRNIRDTRHSIQENFLPDINFQLPW